MTTLRVTAGTLKGRRIPVPRGEVRPTSERARQGYFNIVADRIEGSHFLDLFAGSGIFSFEAISRGGASATAVDQSRANTVAISRVAESLQVAIEVVNSDVISALCHPEPRRRRGIPSPPAGLRAGDSSPSTRLGMTVFDLVYADPPYDYDRYDGLLLAIDRGPLAEDAIVAIEHRRRSEPFSAKTQRLSRWRRAEYGEVWITFFSSVRTT